MSIDETAQTSSESLALVTEVARKRRQEAQEKVLKAPPAFIVDVRKSEATYGFHPRVLPFQLADFTKFRRTLEHEYHLKFVVPEEVPQLMEHITTGSSRKKIDVNAIGGFLFQSDSPKALFRKGRLDMGQRRIVQIDSVLLTVEEIFVGVRGTTEAAELLIKDVAQYLWAASGIERSWEEIEPDVQSKTFGTSTRVKLGFSPEALFSDALCTFLEDSVISGPRYGRLMGRVSDRDAFGPPPQSREAYMLDELEIRVSRHDEGAFREESQSIRIGIGRRDLYGSDVVDCDTVLPYDQHCKFVQDFIQACGSTSK
jgi:hypothetical protein